MSQSSSFVSIEELIGRYTQAQLVYVAARLGLADLLYETAKTVEEVARELSVHADALRRVLTSLVVLGVFERKEDDTYQLATGHEVLVSTHPWSLRSYVLVSGEVYYRVFAELLHSVKTGEPGTGKALGSSLFAYLGQHQELFDHFNVHMSRSLRLTAEAALAAYDFSRYKHVVDIGGGNGMVLAQLLEYAPKMHAILFDLPTVVAQARAYLHHVGVADRCQLVEGDFFQQELPTGGDLYLLSRILHDWSDEEALHLLRTCRRAMSQESTLVLLEYVLPEQQICEQAARDDLFMLVLTGGGERTARQFERLLMQAGFHSSKIVPVQGCRCVIEATPYQESILQF